MITRFLAGCALAFSLLAPVFPAEVGALKVEKLGTKGPGVILIPGLASGAWVWRDTTPRIAKDHRVYLLTLPGFDGRAPQPGVTLETLASDLAALIEKENLDRPVLVGHSLGGTLALAFAAEHSALISGVIAIDGLPVFPGTENAPDRKVLADGTRAQFSGQTREQFIGGQQWYMRTIGAISEPLALELAGLTARSDPGATGDFAAQIMAADLRPKLAAIRVPVVEISPFNEPDFARIGVDEARKTEYYRLLLRGVERLEVVSIAPARHFVMFDQPEKFAAALDQALATMAASKAR
jgi:pimeloyl-ACP methyl ester carboxylesterase